MPFPDFTPSMGVNPHCQHHFLKYVTTVMLSDTANVFDIIRQ